MKRILSLGAGVQSSALLLMSCRGVLPKLDCAIFGDTQWEPKEVYTHLQWLIGESEAHGIPVHIVTAGDIRQDAIDFRTIGSSKDKKRFASLPNFIKNEDGSQGIIRRQCTTEYKIEPVEKFIRREILGLKPRQRAPKEVVVEQWFGISADEVQRMSTSRVPWKVHRYPLIKDLAVTWSRASTRTMAWSTNAWGCVGYKIIPFPLFPFGNDILDSSRFTPYN